ncbi:MAG TPA: hypothetical protein VIG64_09510 [Actinomycetota bacterium]|jgi:hypothetical protein
MKIRLAFVAAVVAALSLSPVGLVGMASACPDPNNPCDINPQEVPGWCKLTPFC